jgi:predicted lipoprotein with Yx(FWY)xxD motif
MPGSERMRSARSRRSRHFWRKPTCFAIVALLLGASLVSTALADVGSLTLGSAPSSTLGEQLLVNAQGRTLYALSPETSSHLLCKSSACLKNWPPVTLRSRTVKLVAGHGVSGRLGILRRGDGLLQLTLRGRPLYRFAGDHGKGEANGENIQSFGGTWHAVTAASPVATAPSPPPTAPPSTPPVAPMPAPTPGYGY